MTRLGRALADIYALGLALFPGLIAAAFRYPVAIVVLVVLVVLTIRIAAEFLIPRGARLELADTLADRKQQVGRALAATEATVRTGVPLEVADKVRDISRIVWEIVERQTRLDGTSPELFSVLRTATDYLPSALDAYMRLPQSYAATRRQAGGMTALEILTEQLDLLEKEMVEVADAVNRHDLDRLLAHGRFLSDRFGRSALTLPDPPSTT